MRTRVISASLLAFAIALSATPAYANHAGNDDTGQYAYNPIEHDDQGSSNEPDGHAADAGIFGPAVSNAVIDRNFDGYADVPVPNPLIPGQELLAPGCTYENGQRAPSGACGIWTVGVGTGPTGTLIEKETVHVPGVTVQEGSCPGRYADAPVVMLDARADFAAAAPGIPSQWYNLNHKVDYLDETSGGLLKALGVVDSVLAGPVAHWAWYGLFEDKNCNGVIDHVPADPGNPAVPNINNEFIWFGSCTDFDGSFQVSVIAGGYCREDPNPNSNPPGQPGGDARTTMYWHIWPGFHAAGYVPDLPTPWNWLEGDAADEWDLQGSDRTGERQAASRLWMGGAGFPVWYYDQSLIFSVQTVTGVNCKDNPAWNPADPQGSQFLLGATGGPGSPCTFVDVDRYPSVSPLLESLLRPLKGATTDTFDTIADFIPTLDDQGPISRLLNSILGKNFYDATGGPQQGLVDDLLLHPGWPREPNVAGVALPTGGVARDQYVDVVNAGPCDSNPDVDDRDEMFRGWCNVNTKGATSAYAAYQGDDFRGWLDLRPHQVLAWIPPVRTAEGGQCIQCLSFVQMMPIFVNPVPDDNPTDASDRSLTFGPGQWLFMGYTGRWKDVPHYADESVFPQNVAEVPCAADPGQEVCVTYARDGWIGWLASGEQEYQGYLPENCSTDLGPGPQPWSVCNPYEDGNVDDPQCLYTALDPEDPEDCQGEWQSTCQMSSDTDKVFVYPADGEWSIPLILWRSWKDGLTLAGGLGDFDVIMPGDTRVLEMRVEQCTAGWQFRTLDHLFMPVGNLGEDMVTVLGPVDIGVNVGGVATQDFITDVDVYAGAVL